MLSPRQNEYASPNLTEYAGMFYYDPLRDGVIAPGLQPVLNAEGEEIDLDGDGNPDTREITDYTFSDVERDQFGRPTAVVENVGLGNAKIPTDLANGEKPTNVNAEDEEAFAACKEEGGYWVDGDCSDTPAEGGSPMTNPDDKLINPDDALTGDTGTKE